MGVVETDQSGGSDLKGGVAYFERCGGGGVVVGDESKRTNQEARI